MNKEVYQEGWLIKSPPTKRIWRARWRRRWFTLKQGEIPEQFCLEYYTDRNCRKLKGIIDLDQCEQVDSGLRLENRKQKFQYMFDIKTPRRTYYLAADTEDDMRDWVNCICQVCNLKDFTKQVGDRQYYNLYENGAQLATVDSPATNNLMSNNVEQHWQSLSCAEDVIRRAEELSISGAYQNHDCSYVNTEYSNRETLICDTKFQEQMQQSQQNNQQDLCSKNDEILQKELQLERSHSLKMSQVSKTDDVPCVSNGNKHLRTKSLNDQADVTPPAIAASSQSKSGLGPTTFPTKKIPENLVLSDTFVDSNVEPSPALSTCSGPYIPISECFSGSPKYLNENNPTTPLNNLDPKFYDTPRSHNNVGLNLTSDQSYSPKIYNCPQQPRPRSGRSSPTDSESVFTDDEEWPHASPRRESIDRNTRPSDSSVENEAIVFTYAQRFSKIPEDSKSCGGAIDAGSECDSKRQAKMKSLILEDCDDDEKNREFPQYSDTDNSSPAIGPKDATSVVEESYDIPRSHQLAHYNKKQCNSNSTSPNLSCLKDSIASSTPNLAVDNQLTRNVGSKTLPRSHFYTNAAPCNIEGNVFRYDFMEQSDPPAVNRSLKPKLSLEEKTSSLELPLKSVGSGSRNSAESSPKPPSVDRKLKPAALKNADLTSNTSSLRRRVAPLSVGASFESDNMDSPKDFESRTLPRNSIHAGSVGNVSTSGTLSKATAGTTAKSNSQLQYFDLDVANPPSKAVNRSIYPNNSPSVAHTLSLNTSIDSVSRQPTKSNVIYNSVDFLRTEAIKKIRQDAEKNRMKD